MKKTVLFVTLLLSFQINQSYAANYKPVVVAVSPSSGTSAINQQVIFATTFSDQNGWKNTNSAYLFVNTGLIYTNCFYGYYNQNTNKFYLRDNNNKNWIGGYAPGAVKVIENSYAKLDISKCSVSGSGSTITIKWAGTFKSTFIGPKNMYLYITDDSGAANGWVKKGGWQIVAPDTAPPTGTISINNNAAYTNTTAITLNLFAQDNLGGTGVDKMQFSTDGITWSALELYATSKAWNLTSPDGEKSIYVRYSDKAGNISQAYSAKIALVYGDFVDNQNGGEVISADSKVRLSIPPDALWESTPISIKLIDSGLLENSSPENYKVKVVVECKPARLIFKKPCKLTVAFDEPDIPGTVFELGLLDEETNQIVLMEESSPIKTDGLTLQFPITHFSTYAGLSGMLSQGAPIGSGVNIPLPDLLTGAFGHSITVTVPPGRKGMQPGINLQYRSSNPNSWVGVGWSINPGYIVRSTKLGSPTYNDQTDTFIFVTDSGSTELVHLIDNLYQAKIESAFAKFYKEADDSWKVVQKDGTLLKFGQTSDSKEISDSGTFLWNLTKAVDSNSNYIELFYTRDQGKSYLSQIDYTGNDSTGTSPANSVEFALEDRTDISSTYLFGSEIKTAKRLSEIQVKQQNELVWRYQLSYEYSPGSKRSLLKVITQYSSDGKAFPSQTFKYQAADD
ncbi:MAG: hypothetical protein NTV07_00295 [Candidatus Omnitrophica bacterium]|nr:hypothetical protein [Candidatus Omnitrophota bacterium]